MHAETYADTLEWLDRWHLRPHLPAATVGLDRARFLLARLDDPHRAFRSVHVAGSTGKGSTTTFVGSVLQAAGYRTGYFLSPHLESYRERIAINGVSIDEQAWVGAFNRVVDVAERMETGSVVGASMGRPSLFEVLFAIAALHFRGAGVEWAAIETGMGGRLDATNTVESDVAVLTNISLEHTNVLGDTVEQIAREKAAIIKRGSSAVTAEPEGAALQVIADRAREHGVSLRRLGTDFFVSDDVSDDRGVRTRIWDASTSLDVHLGIGGLFQMTNAATAFGTARQLQERGVRLTAGHIRFGLESARVPGRFEKVCTCPDIVIDGAHNHAAFRALRQSLQNSFPNRRIVLLFAALSDKNIPAMASEIAPVVDAVIVTNVPGTNRAASAKTQASAFSGRCRSVSAVEDQAAALDRALDEVGEDGLLVIAGSLYLVGWARERVAHVKAAV